MCFGFLEDRNVVWDDKVLSKFKVSEWLTKHQQIHRPVCLFTSASSGMCTKRKVSKHRNQLTHKVIHKKKQWKQVDKFTLTQIGLDFCLSVKKPHPSQALCTPWFSFLSSSEERLLLWASMFETELQLFSLQKHLSKQQQSQGQVSPVSDGDSSWQKVSRDNS